MFDCGLEEEMRIKLGKLKQIVVIGIFAILVVILLVVIFVKSGTSQRKIKELLDLGQKYLDDQAYEEAGVMFDKVIAVEPKCEQAYLGKAKAQYALGQYEKAVNTLKEGINIVENSTEMETFLRQILDELSATEEKSTMETTEASLVEFPFTLSDIKILGYDLFENNYDKIKADFGMPTEEMIRENGEKLMIYDSDLGHIVCNDSDDSIIISDVITDNVMLQYSAGELYGNIGGGVHYANLEDKKEYVDLSEVIEMPFSLGRSYEEYVHAMRVSEIKEKAKRVEKIEELSFIYFESNLGTGRYYEGKWWQGENQYPYGKNIEMDFYVEDRGIFKIWIQTYLEDDQIVECSAVFVDKENNEVKSARPWEW